MKKIIVKVLKKEIEWLRKCSLQRKAIIERNCHIDLLSQLEGANRLAKGSSLYNSRLGYGSYLSNNSRLENTYVGRFSSIGPRVYMIIGEHPLNMVSTHPCFYSTLKQVGFSYVNKNKFEEFRYADSKQMRSVIIGNDVWIGADCRIIEGITIGDGAVVLAGAVVAKDVPPYAIVGGVPAKVMRYRFSEEEIQWLLKLKWWNKDEKWLKIYAGYFDDIKRLKQGIKENIL